MKRNRRMVYIVFSVFLMMTVLKRQMKMNRKYIFFFSEMQRWMKWSGWHRAKKNPSFAIVLKTYKITLRSISKVLFELHSNGNDLRICVEIAIFHSSKLIWMEIHSMASTKNLQTAYGSRFLSPISKSAVEHEPKVFVNTFIW